MTDPKTALDRLQELLNKSTTYGRTVSKEALNQAAETLKATAAFLETLSEKMVEPPKAEEGAEATEPKAEGQPEAPAQQ